MKIKKTKTNRGFDRIDFTDRYDNECSIQLSSLATEDAIWFGIDEARPHIMARDAIAMGREDLLNPVGDPERMNGWVNWPVPDQVNMWTRMHLTRKQVKKLIPILKKFADTGSIR